MNKVDVETLMYWAKHEVGGSGMGIRMQQMLKDMAIEILEHRGIDVELTTEWMEHTDGLAG